MTGCPLHSPELRSHIIFYTFFLLRLGRKCQLGPQRMETSHDLSFRNIPPPCTSDEKGFQPWGWKCTPSSRVPLLPLLNATSRNRLRTPAVAHTLPHTSAYVWAMHPGVDVRTHPLCTGAKPPGKGPGTSSRAAL